MGTKWDILLAGGLVFDGQGSIPETSDIAIRDGVIAARGRKLDRANAVRVIDVSDLWIMPGLIDLHTHLDLEVEVDPGLREAVRHGTTTVLVSNCSLGLAFGAQRRNDEDPIVDCFARVENMPKKILRSIADRIEWDNSSAYLEHLDQLPLGANVAAMIPHSMLRAEVMGLKGSVSREPTDDELRRMEELLERGMGEGYVGMSTDALPFHFLSEAPNQRKRIPSQFGRYGELRRLTTVLRRFDRLWQATPAKDKPLRVLRDFLLTSGLLHGKTLKVTAVAALDIASDRTVRRLALMITRILNWRPLRGYFRFQALAAPFLVYWDGPVNPLAEEIPEFRELNELDLDDQDGRRALLSSEDFRRRFTKMWTRGKNGFGFSAMRRRLRLDSLAFDRDPQRMIFHSGCPQCWVDESFAEVHSRFCRWLDDSSVARDHVEEVAFKNFPADASKEAAFILHLFREYDTELRWWTISANRDPVVVRELLNHPEILPGFNDSGAHITNLAFYDGNLRCLQLAQQENIERVATQVKRLTTEPAELIGIDCGGIAVGHTADIIAIDPDALRHYDSVEKMRFIYRAEYSNEQLVNRSDGVVPYVFVGGRLVWNRTKFSPNVARQRIGRTMRHRDWNSDAHKANFGQAAGKQAVHI